MTDPSTQPAAPPSPPPSLSDAAAASQAAAITSVVRSAPELAGTPGTTVTVSQTPGDVKGTAQAVAAASNRVSRADGATQAQTAQPGIADEVFGFFGKGAHLVAQGATDVLGSKVTHAIGTAVSDVGNVLNVGMQFAQHEYRYLHDVEARHGILAATLEGFGIAAGAAAGFAGGGFGGAIIGGEAATALEGRIFYNDSWQRTTDGTTYHDPHTGQSVSFGRDIGQHLGLKPGTSGFQIASGVLDGMFDLTTDPLNKVGGLVGAARGAGAPGKLGDYFPGTQVVTPEDVIAAYKAPANVAVRRAFGQFATMNGGEIAAMDNRLEPIAKQLGDAKTADEVRDVFVKAVAAHELITTDRLPTMTLTHQIGRQVREAIANRPDFEGLNPVTRALAPALSLQRASKRLESLPVTYDPKKFDFSSQEIDPTSKFGAQAVYRIMRFGYDHDTSTAVADAYLNNPDLANRALIYRNSIQQMLLSMAGVKRGLNLQDLTDPTSFQRNLQTIADPDVRSGIKKEIDAMTGGGMPGKSGVYGHDANGSDVSEIELPNGETSTAAIRLNQTGNWSIPTLRGVHRTASMLRGSKDLFGGIDDFAYFYATQGAFKPLILLTPSYAMHISAAELVPNSMRVGLHNLVKSAISINRVKLDQVGTASKITDIHSTDDIEKMMKGKGVVAQAWQKYKVNQGIKGDEHPDVGAVVGVVAKALRIDRTHVLPDAERVQLAARAVDFLGGHTLPTALRSGEAYSKEVVNQSHNVEKLTRDAFFRIPKKMRSSKVFGEFHRGDENFVDHWQSNLAEAANDEPTRLAATRLAANARTSNALRPPEFTDELGTGRFLPTQGVDPGLLAAKADAQSAVKDWLLHHQDDLGDYIRAHPAVFGSHSTPLPPGWTNWDDWASKIVDAVTGDTTGADGTTHLNLLDHIANGEHTPTGELDSVASKSRPGTVKGRTAVPSGSSPIQKIADLGFRHALNPIVNFLSREPIFHDELFRQYKLLEPLLDAHLIDEGEAMTVAMSRSVFKVIRNVHNLHDRTQWTVALRNWAPFFFAQEQAYRRGGRLLAEDPGAFRKYQLSIQAAHSIGAKQSDGQGNSYYILPGTGSFSSSAPNWMSGILGLSPQGAAPMGLGWNLGSMSVVFPMSGGVRPDVGPLVGLSVDALDSVLNKLPFSATQKNVIAQGSSLIQGSYTASNPWWEQLIPNTFVQRMLTAAQGDSRAIYSTMNQVMQSLDFQQQQAMAKWVADGHQPTDPGHPQFIPDPNAGPVKMQEFLDRLRNQVRIMYATRAMVGLVTPVSPEVTADNYGFPAQLATDIQKTGSVIKGTQEFLAKNPDALPWTVFQSKTTSGAPLLSSKAAEDWIDQNASLIRDFPYAATWLMPQLTDTKYDPTIYNEQIAQGYRAKFPPGQIEPGGGLTGFLAQLYIAAGNHIYYDESLVPHQLAQGTLTGPALAAAQAKFPGIQPLYGPEKTAESARWSTWLTQFQKMNPIWATDFGDTGQRTARRQQAILELQQVFASGQAPKNQMSTEVSALLRDFESYHAAYTSGKADSFAAGSATELKNNWESHLDDVKAAHPELAPIIQSVFVSASPA